MVYIIYSVAIGTLLLLLRRNMGERGVGRLARGRWRTNGRKIEEKLGGRIGRSQAKLAICVLWNELQCLQCNALLPMLLGHTLCKLHSNIESLQKVIFNTSAPSTYGFPKASNTFCWNCFNILLRLPTLIRFELPPVTLVEWKAKTELHNLQQKGGELLEPLSRNLSALLRLSRDLAACLATILHLERVTHTKLPPFEREFKPQLVLA